MWKINDKIVSFIEPEQIDGKAIKQLGNCAEMSFVEGVAAMPDCHPGMGATVGSVILTNGHVMPAAVGVDIGCSMIAVRTKFSANDLPDSMDPTRDGIKRRIPVGTGGCNQQLSRTADKRYRKLRESQYFREEDDYSKFSKNWHLQLGSLGSGNHFIEICLDENDQVWAMLHSGSRGIGNRLASSHIKIAQKLMDEHHFILADRDLAFFIEGTSEFKAYIRDLLFCQEYAKANIMEMMDRVVTELSYLFYKENGHQQELEQERIVCHHNFTQQEVHNGMKLWVTRKGAIQTMEGQRGIIPGAMGAKSYIVTGKGNPASYNSAPHGAGRPFSRGDARKKFSMNDLEESMKGISCDLREALIDEYRGAYKDIGWVIDRSSDLISVDHVLHAVACVKGD